MLLTEEVVERTCKLVEAANSVQSTQNDLSLLASAFEQIKQSPVAIEIAQLGHRLTEGVYSIEVQLAGYSLLQYVVEERWAQLSEEEKNGFVHIAWQRLSEDAKASETWALWNKKSLLMALTMRSSRTALWRQLLPELQNLAGHGPIQAVKACLVLKMLMEEVQSAQRPNSAEKIAHANEWMREMLSETSLNSLLPFLHTCMESYFIRAAKTQKFAETNPDCQAVLAGCEVLVEYAERAPVSKIAEAKLIQALGWMCTTNEFRLAAIMVLRKIFERKFTPEDSEGFNGAMRQVGQALTMAAKSFLTPQNIQHMGSDGPLEEMAMHVSVSLGLFGYRHIHAVEEVEQFLDLNMEFVKSDNIRIMHSAISLWVNLLGYTERRRQVLSDVFNAPDKYVILLLQIAGQRLRLVQAPSQDAELPTSFMSYDEYHSFISEVRQTLVHVIGLSASILPNIALQEAGQQILALKNMSMEPPTPIQVPISPELYATFLLTETLISGVSEKHLPGGIRRLRASLDPNEVGFILDCLESRFSELIAISFRDFAPAYFPFALVMEAFWKLVLQRKHVATLAIQKVLSILGQDLCVEGGAQNLPQHPPPGWKLFLRARLRIITTLSKYAKFAPESMLPHVEELAIKTEEMWQNRTISPGEKARLSEMMLACVSTTNRPYQQQVVSHLLRGIAEMWQTDDWIRSFSAPENTIALLFPFSETPSGSEVGGGFERWILFNQLFVLEKAFLRLPGSGNLDGDDLQAKDSKSWHVLNAHLGWILPTVIQLLKTLNALYTPQGLALLKGASSALVMGVKEQAFILKQIKSMKQDEQKQEEDEATIAGKSVASLRSFLKHSRDYLCQILGSATIHVGGFYQSGFHTQFVEAVSANLDGLPHAELKQTIRKIFLPLVKNCPPKHRDAWLVPILTRFLPHTQARLTSAWNRICSGGHVNGGNTLKSAQSANNEIIEEDTLRNLTTDHLVLLRCTLGAKEDASIPSKSAEQSVIDLLIQTKPDIALSACHTAISALFWPDKCVVRASAFLRAVIPRVGRQMLDQGAGKEMLRGSLLALTTDVLFDSEVMNLIRDLLKFQPPIAGTPEVLLELPSITPERLTKLQASLSSNHSERGQRLIIKNFLGSSGHEKLEKALAEWNVPNHIEGSPQKSNANGHRHNGNPENLEGLADIFREPQH